jgi:hypothetical protein
MGGRLHIGGGTGVLESRRSHGPLGSPGLIAVTQLVDDRNAVCSAVADTMTLAEVDDNVVLRFDFQCSLDSDTLVHGIFRPPSFES